MSCSDVVDLIEPIAAGELAADEAVRAHLQSCVTCAAALASAQRLESALKGMEIPPAPPAFTAMVLQRIRRDHWQSEQNVDRLFNLAMVAAVLLMIGGVAAMLNVDAGTGDDRVGAGVVAGRDAGERSPGCADTGHLRCRRRAPGLRARHVVVGRTTDDVLDGGRRSAVRSAPTTDGRLAGPCLLLRPGPSPSIFARSIRSGAGS